MVEALLEGIGPVDPVLVLSSMSITLDTYLAVLPNMQREAAERLARTFDVRQAADKRRGRAVILIFGRAGET